MDAYESGNPGVCDLKDLNKEQCEKVNDATMSGEMLEDIEFPLLHVSCCLNSKTVFEEIDELIQVERLVSITSNEDESSEDTQNLSGFTFASDIKKVLAAIESATGALQLSPTDASSNLLKELDRLQDSLSQSPVVENKIKGLRSNLVNDILPWTPKSSRKGGPIFSTPNSADDSRGSEKQFQSDASASLSILGSDEMECDILNSLGIVTPRICKEFSRNVVPDPIPLDMKQASPVNTQIEKEPTAPSFGPDLSLEMSDEKKDGTFQLNGKQNGTFQLNDDNSGTFCKDKAPANSTFNKEDQVLNRTKDVVKDLNDSVVSLGKGCFEIEGCSTNLMDMESTDLQKVLNCSTNVDTPVKRKSFHRKTSMGNEKKSKENVFPIKTKIIEDVKGTPVIKLKKRKNPEKRGPLKATVSVTGLTSPQNGSTGSCKSGVSNMATAVNKRLDLVNDKNTNPSLPSYGSVSSVDSDKPSSFEIGTPEVFVGWKKNDPRLTSTPSMLPDLVRKFPKLPSGDLPTPIMPPEQKMRCRVELSEELTHSDPPLIEKLNNIEDGHQPSEDDSGTHSPVRVEDKPRECHEVNDTPLSSKTSVSRLFQRSASLKQSVSCENGTPKIRHGNTSEMHSRQSIKISATSPVEANCTVDIAKVPQPSSSTKSHLAPTPCIQTLETSDTTKKSVSRTLKPSSTKAIRTKSQTAPTVKKMNQPIKNPLKTQLTTNALNNPKKNLAKTSPAILNKGIFNNDGKEQPKIVKRTIASKINTGLKPKGIVSNGKTFPKFQPKLPVKATDCADKGKIQQVECKIPRVSRLPKAVSSVLSSK